MATKLSDTSSLPWIWVIEALASFNEIETSLLTDLVNKTPEMSDDLGRNAKEIVSSRVLESLFIQKTSNANNVASVPGAKIELDPSNRSEDVLQHILLKTSTSDLKTGAPQTLKWDMQTFIKKKRSSLPNCFLKQLKDSIADSANPLSASLRERSGLEIGDHSRDSVHVVVVDTDGFKQGHEVGGMNSLHVAPAGNLDTTHTNMNGLQENQPGSTGTYAKRSIDAPTADEIEINEPIGVSENSTVPCAKAAKKFKQDIVNPTQNIAPDMRLSQKYGFPSGSCGGSQPFVLKGNSVGEAHVEAFIANGCLKDGSTKYAASKSVLRGSDSNRNELLPQRMSADKRFQSIESSCNGCAASGTSSDSSQRVIQQDSHNHLSKHDFGRNLPRHLQTGEPSKGGKENIVENFESEFPTNTDEYHEESADLTAVKNDFLSQCSQGEDAMGTADVGELNCCVKCNGSGSGELLVCSSDTCLLVVHESCLSSIPKFDHKGKFYCPYCAYSQAISEYAEVKKKYVEVEKKAVHAKKYLAAFVCVGTEQKSKKSLSRSHGAEQNQSQQDKNEQLSHNEKGEKSLNDVTEAGSDKPPLRRHRLKPNQSREEEELHYKKNRNNNSLEKAKKVASGPVDRNPISTEVMQMHPPQQGAEQNQSQQDKNEQLGLNEKGEKSLNDVTKAGSAPADRSCVGAQVIQTGSRQPESSVPKDLLVAGKQPDKPPVRCHRLKQNQSREEEELELHRNENINITLEKAKKVASGPVDGNPIDTEVMQKHPPQQVPHEHVCEESSLEECSEEEDDEIGSRNLRSRNPVKE